MQRMKRKMNSESYSAGPARQRTPSASSDSSDDLEIVEVDPNDLGQPSRTGGAAWADSDDSSDDETEVKRTKRFEKQFGPVPRFLTSKKPHKTEYDSSSESESEAVSGSTAWTGRLLASSSALPSTGLGYKRLRDLNADQPAKSTVSSVRFHPWSPVALVGSTDRTLNMFHVDGDSNAKLAGHYFDHFPVKCARFTPDGKKVVLSSIRKSFRIFDMETERVTPVHGFRGITAAIQQFEISPDGKYAVFIGQQGALHVIELASLEKVATLEANGRIMALAFAGDVLCAFGDEGRVYRFSMADLRLTDSFLDEACVGGRGLAISPDNALLASGHSTGIVNLYRHADTFCRSSPPRPQKTVSNLVTACDRLRFGPAGDLLVMASSADYSAVRVLHTASGRVLGNFPGRADRFGKISDLDISPGGGFLAIGQTDGRVKLLRLLHYEKF